MTRGECQATKYRDKEIKEDMICAAEAGKDSCQVQYTCMNVFFGLNIRIPG